MTNLILREGYYVRFQQNAMVYTNVPTNYTTLCKMFLRWARSNIRETLVMCRFAFRRFRQGSMLGARVNLLLSLLALTKSQAFLLITFGLMFWRPVEIGLNLLLGVVVCSSLSAMIYLWKYRTTDALWAYGYGLFWFLSLSWITPYALFTPHRAGWLTRQARKGGKVQVQTAPLDATTDFGLPLISFDHEVSTLAVPVRTLPPRHTPSVSR